MSYIIRKAKHYATCHRCGGQIVPGDAIEFEDGTFLHGWPCESPGADK